MNVNRRLSKLEEHPAFVGTPPLVGVPAGFTLEAEARRWCDLTDPLESLINPGLADQFYMAVAQRFLEMRDFAWPGPQCCPRLVATLRKLPGLLAMLLPKTPADLRPDVARALSVNLSLGNRRLGRFQSWLFDIAAGDGRLPPDASGETVGRVLRALGEAPGGTMGICQVCVCCGLPRPRSRYDQPDLLAGACPHCGEASGTRSNQVGEGRPWQARAAAELDPDTSPERRGRRHARG